VDLAKVVERARVVHVGHSTRLIVAPHIQVEFSSSKLHINVRNESFIPPVQQDLVSDLKII
jgi:hypothetical protein